MNPEHNENNDSSINVDSIREYQEFIDGLLEWPRHSVHARWVREWEPDPPPRTYVTPPEFNEKMRLFTREQREIVADLLQEEREGTIHSVLAYLTDLIHGDGLRLYRNGVPVAIEPYGSEMYYDWTCRCLGGDWPEDELE